MWSDSLPWQFTKCTFSRSAFVVNVGPAAGEVSTTGTAPRMLRTLILVDFTHTLADRARHESGRGRGLAAALASNCASRWAGDDAPVRSGMRPTTRVGPRNFVASWL